jgi:hypothetical protein
MPRITRNSLLQDFRDLDEDDASSVVRAAKAIRDARNMREVERQMDKIDRLIGGHGVEALYFKEGLGIRGFASEMEDELLAVFVNTGDLYNPTVLWDAKKDTVTLTSWGDFTERLPRKYRGW